MEGHQCPGDAAPRRRCAAAGCREPLGAHNTVRCWRCSQDVCVRHRFEEDHPCVSVRAAVAAALAQARLDMVPEEFLEAHRTLSRIFGNILADPTNEKYRTLNKANAVVKEKLRHPSCIAALQLCGFTDGGEAYVCRPAADLALMREMAGELKALPEFTELPSPGAAAGTRLVDGVIVRTPAVPSRPAVGPRGAAGQPTAVKAGKPRGAGFERRAQQQPQDAALQELRQLRKERYRATGTGGAASPSDVSEDAEVGSSPGSSSPGLRASGRQLQPEQPQCSLQ